MQNICNWVDGFKGRSQPIAPHRDRRSRTTSIVRDFSMKGYCTYRAYSREYTLFTAMSSIEVKRPRSSNAVSLCANCVDR
jgi:hypothetical protein